MTKPCFPGTGIPYGRSPFPFFRTAVAIATRTLFRFGGAGDGVGLGEVLLFDAFEASLGGVSLFCLRLVRCGCGGCGFGVGRANVLRIDLNTSSRGPAFAASVVAKTVKTDRHTTIVRSDCFITRKDTACIFWRTLVLLQNLTIPGETDHSTVATAVSAIFARARVNALCRFVNPVLAFAWRELLPAALGAERWPGPASTKSRSTTLSDPTPMA